ncbi:MAG: DegT/DnrJ/EryC1/StrS family aminotransferase [Alkalispirochaetaceae bacterium]
MVPLPDQEPIPFARPHLGAEEEAAVLRVLRSGWLTTAGEAAAFESEFAAHLGVPFAMATNSATSGLHLALEALGISPGQRVAMSPYTFTASAEVCRYCGAEPLFVDIGEEGFLIDPDAFDRIARSPEGGELAAVMPVHIAGEPCDMVRIRETADACGLAVVEDAAHAFPLGTDLGPVGTLSDVGVFSFYANKTITTGEGGMVVTAHKELAERIRLMRMHGIDRDVWDRYRSRGAAWEYEVVEAGFKYNLPDILAAIGRVQLRRAVELKERRRRIAERYLDAFASRDYLILPRVAGDHAWHLFILRLRLEGLTIDRDGFIEELTALGIGSSVHYKPLHLMPYWRDRLTLTPEDFPNATRRFEEVVSLPLWPGMSEQQVDRTIEAVLTLGDRFRRRGGF